MLNSTRALGLAWPQVISTGSQVHTTANLALWFGPSVVNLRMAMSYLSNPMAVLVFHKSRRKNTSPLQGELCISALGAQDSGDQIAVSPSN